MLRACLTGSLDFQLVEPEPTEREMLDVRVCKSMISIGDGRDELEALRFRTGMFTLFPTYVKGMLCCFSIALLEPTTSETQPEPEMSTKSTERVPGARAKTVF